MTRWFLILAAPICVVLSGCGGVEEESTLKVHQCICDYTCDDTRAFRSRVWVCAETRAWAWDMSEYDCYRFGAGACAAGYLSDCDCDCAVVEDGDSYELECDAVNIW
jgi:hypothetical protein